MAGIELAGGDRGDSAWWIRISNMEFSATGSSSWKRRNGLRRPVGNVIKSQSAATKSRLSLSLSLVGSRRTVQGKSNREMNSIKPSKRPGASSWTVNRATRFDGRVVVESAD